MAAGERTAISAGRGAERRLLERDVEGLAVVGLGRRCVREEFDDHTRLRLLHELGSAFAARLELDELVPLVVMRCQDALDVEGVSVLLHDGERDELYFPYVVAEDPDVAARLVELRFPAARGIAGEVLRTGESLAVDDVAGDPRFYGDVDRATGVRTRAILTVPLTSHQGRIGVLQAVNPRSGAFLPDDLAFLEVLGGSVGTAIENARMYERLKDMADGLRAQVGVLRRDLARREGFDDIIGTGPGMTEVFHLMESAAASPIAVLIEGETGTGKELVARGIHRASVRAEAPFVAVNCAALPETLLESELFGHRRGAYTGAISDQPGLFESAAGGTVLLDEIGEMPLPMQAKLLRVLQEGEILRIGDQRPRKVDVRVISATNRNLSEEIAARRFREDLYYRLAAFPIQMPPLRERRFDIPRLADCILAAAAERHHRRIAGIEPEALARLVAFGWPGNVRELQNEIERAVALAQDGERIGLAHLSPKLRLDEAPARADAAVLEETLTDLRQARATFEAQHVRRVLAMQGGNVTRAAIALGLSRSMLHNKMKELGIRPT
jgi:transcriptional regulator with GAF, ATPase, and Fis domain